ncbi:LOW QUALITY PROTEIN: serine-rich adhesin for platelets-like [Palaemon carinicauda]|uniref:LOW QUALITY PROTEIN: serine-rich adhesin for platelets-like n=1 Tax=Palaemon carinicauda TaxID=392227 RepID=UPI0035B5ED55
MFQYTVIISVTRSGSRSSGGSSPAGLHGRALPLKTAVVAPAPSRLTPKANSLNRFGFRNSAQSKSGDSTDSVNSFLSDAQTTGSDSNSNIFDLCDDENENKSTNKNSESVSDDNAFARSPRLDSVDSARVTPATPRVSILVPKHVPTPNSTPLSNRLTIHTRQLPKPQVVTVKPVSPKVQTSVCNSPSISNVASGGRTRSPSVKSLLRTPLKSAADSSPAIKQQSNSTLRAPRDSRDSESSTKSTTELDSGLGSSSESDRIRGGEGDADALDPCDAEKAEDPSDEWLKKTRQQLAASKRKSRGSMEIQFNGTSSFEIKRQSLEGKEKTASGEDKVSPLTVRGVTSLLDKKLEAGKDKRDSTITYGMARQKFAPYSRSRYGYGYQSAQTRTGSSTPSPASSTASSLTSAGSPGSGITKIPGSAGLVRSRVAMIETPLQAKKTTLQQTPPVVLRRSNLKKPLIRPTSLEKTPILVMPAAEKTVELSRPVCRKLEYSENTAGTPKKNEAQRDDQMWENELSQEGKDLILHQVSQPVEDILIVGSVEVETHKDINIMQETDQHGSFYENGYDKGFSLDRSDIAFKATPNNCVTELKAYRDPVEKEKADRGPVTREAKVADVPEVLGVSEKEEAGRKHNVVTPDDSGIKLVSPQSESSFEILESLSETVDLTEDTRKSTVDLTSEEQDAESTVDESNGGETRAGSADTKATDATEDAMLLISPEAKIESSVDSAFSSEHTTVTSVDGDSEFRRPTLEKSTPNHIPNSSECVLSSDVISKSSQLQEGQDNSAVEAKKPLPSGGSIPFTRLSSLDLKTAMESSIESHKSVSAMSILTDSAEHSNHSGKCTPTLTTGRSDLDQDFLIDDEIADQPGLMFGGSAMASSFFTDDSLFDDIGTSPPPCHSQLKQVIAGSSRSRANSIDTASSVGGDDLMLDYFDMEEAKTGGSSNRSSVSSCLSLPTNLTGARPKKMHLRITIPGRRYEEEVLSPDANEIFSEWTAMMAEVSGAVSERCVSREGSTTSSGGGGGGGGTGGSRTSRPRLSSSSELSTDSRRPTVLRPPRQGGLTEMEGSVGSGGVGSPGGVFVDRTAYHYMCQDVTSLKTMLLRLRRVLQVAETINPFDANLRNSLYLSLAGSDSTLSSPGVVNGDKDCPSAPSVNELSQENTDLRRQVVLLQQQLQERDRTIRLLQQQLAQNIESQQQQQQQQPQTGPSAGVAENGVGVEAATCNGRVNAATQTDRSSRSTTLRGSSLSRTASIDDGLGPTVSSELDATEGGRSTSVADHHQPRAASQPPGELLVQ